MSVNDVREIVQETVHQEFRQWSGPLPHPEDLRQYDDVVPGCAAQIIQAFTEQGSHRRDLEKAVVHGSERRANRGQILVFILLIVVVLGGLAIAEFQNAIAGASIVGAALAGGIALYIIGGRSPDEGK